MKNKQPLCQVENRRGSMCAVSTQTRPNATHPVLSLRLLFSLLVVLLIRDIATEKLQKDQMHPTSL